MERPTNMRLNGYNLGTKLLNFNKIAFNKRRHLK